MRTGLEDDDGEECLLRLLPTLLYWNMCKHVDISIAAAGGRVGGLLKKRIGRKLRASFGRGARRFLRGTREGKYTFIEASMAVFRLAGAENGGFRQGGVDGGHFNST